MVVRAQADVVGSMVREDLTLIVWEAPLAPACR